MPDSQFEENLERYLSEIEGLSGSDRGSATSEATCRTLARRMPLSHTRGGSGFKGVLIDGRILSREEAERLGRLPREASVEGITEELLGTRDFVFTYSGPFRYLGTSCGLLFSHLVEAERSHDAIATPFDSGGTIHHFRRHDSTHDQRAFLRRYELPVPQYRSALARTLAICFGSPWHYLDGTPPKQLPPPPIEGGDARRWTFEVRFHKELRLTGDGLIAAFLPVAVAAQDWVHPWMARWKRIGVHVEVFRADEGGAWDALHRRGVEFLRRYLQESTQSHHG